MYTLKLIGIVLIGIFLTVIVCMLLLLLRFAIQARPRRSKEDGFPFVYVNDDGSARELDESEKEYLSTEFHPADGGRPYIKGYYEELTLDGKIKGYIRRRQLPRDIEICDQPTSI